MFNKKLEVASVIAITCLNFMFIGSAVFGLGNESNGTATGLSMLDTKNWKNYSSPVYGLEMKYPIDWESIENGERLFFQPINNPGDFGYFYITSYRLEKDETIQNILRDDIFSVKSRDLKNVVMIEPNKTKLASGSEIYQYQYRYDSDFATRDPTVKHYIAITVDGGLKYFIEYEGHSDVFERHIPIVDTMINSFKPINFEFPASTVE